MLKSIQSQIDIEVQRYTESVLQISPIDILKNLNPTNKTLILIGEQHTINTSPFFKKLSAKTLLGLLPLANLEELVNTLSI